MQKRIDKVRRPLKQKITVGICLIVFLIDISCILINYSNYMNVNKDYTDSLAQTVANTSKLVVDGDLVTDYLANRNRDTMYYEVWNKLIDYCNTNKDIIRVSVINFTEAGGVYVYDTELSEDGAFLGDTRAFDNKQQACKQSLLACENVVTIDYADRRDYYTPLYSSYNIPVAYIIVSISTENVRMEQFLYLMSIICIVTSIAVVFGGSLIWYMNRHVVNPINDMTRAADNYSVEVLHEGKESPISRMEIKTGDELERLCNSMKKMEKDIVESTSQLAIADWNSNHDSMTQLYNKRYYEGIQKVLKDREDVGIVYLDIDNLKKMNDTYGHEKGDEVIINGAEMIKKYLQPNFSCCRVGGDEFVIFVPGCSEGTLMTLVEMMKADEDGNLSDTTAEFYCRLAIGGAFRKKGEAIPDLIKRAEEEMYKNKHFFR